jgi:hypothetical protein
MALIPYQYNATTDDIWLYRNEQTDPYINSQGQQVISTFQTPYAWNPNSPLYPYRRSIEGISAMFRTFSTSAAEEAPGYVSYIQFNPGLTGKNPVFYNSYPPTALLVNSRAIQICSHCQGPRPFRDPTKTWRNFRGTGYLSAVERFRFIDGDDNRVDIDPEDVLQPYAADGQFLLSDNDNGWTELAFDIPINPIQAVADLNGCPPNRSSWYIDGSMKIIPGQCFRGFYRDYANPGYPSNGVLFASTNDQNNIPVRNYKHDSGSLMLVEVKSPTSAEAGDGVLAVVANHVYSSPDFVEPTKKLSVTDYRQGKGFYNYWVEYRGLTLPQIYIPIPSETYPVANLEDGQDLLSQSLALKESIE